MASRTAFGDASVVHGGTGERGHRQMTGLASGNRRRNVVAWFDDDCFGHRKVSAAGMAGSTASSNAFVVHGSTSERGGRQMAGLARGNRGRDMVAWFSQACTACDVAARTACSNAGVVHRRATLE